MANSALYARDQLINNPSTYTTPTALRDLANSVDATATGLADLFFSSAGGTARNIAQQIVDIINTSGVSQEIGFIGNSEAGIFTSSPTF